MPLAVYGFRARRATPLLLGAFGTQGALLLSGVLVARTLGVSGRGTFAAVTFVCYLGMFAGGLSTAQYARLLVVEGHAPRAVARSTTRAVAPLLLALTPAVAVASFALSGDPLVAVLGAASVPFLVHTAQSTLILQGRGRYWAAAVLQILPPLLYGVGYLAFVGAGSAGLRTALASWLFGMVCGSVLGLLLMRRERGSADDENHAGPSRSQIRRRGAAGALASSSPLESLRIDQAAVLLLVGSNGLGLYVTAAAFSNLAKLLGSAASVPVPAIMQGEVSAARRRVGVLALLSVVAGAGVACVAPFLVVPVFGSDFADASALTIPLCLAGGLLGARTVLNEAMRARGQEAHSSVIEFTAVTVFLVIAVGGWLGGLGVAGPCLALLAAALVSATLVWRRVRQDPPRMMRGASRTGDPGTRTLDS